MVEKIAYDSLAKRCTERRALGKERKHRSNTVSPDIASSDINQLHADERDDLGPTRVRNGDSESVTSLLQLASLTHRRHTRSRRHERMSPRTVIEMKAHHFEPATSWLLFESG